jgi:DNA polymerase III epsilon subunit-like protein
MSKRILESVAVLDIEATATNALGFITGYGFLNNGVFTYDFLDGKTVDEGEKILLSKLSVNISKCHKLVGHFIRLYDLRMITSRMLLYGLDPAPFFKVPVIDTWEVARDCLLLPKNTLEDLCRFFGIPKDTSLTGDQMPTLYMKAFQGDKETLQKIKSHCFDDCVATLAVYTKLKTLIEGQSKRYYW